MGLATNEDCKTRLIKKVYPKFGKFILSNYHCIYHRRITAFNHKTYEKNGIESRNQTVENEGWKP